MSARTFKHAAHAMRRVPGNARHIPNGKNSKKPKFEFTPREARIIREHCCPQKVQLYLHSLRYNHEKPDTARSFRRVVRDGKAHCLEGMITAAVILEQHGYPALFLDMKSKGVVEHVVYIYRSRRTGLWGAVGKSAAPGLCGRKAVFRTIRGLVYSYFDPFIDMDGRIIGYGIGNLHSLGDYDWRFSEKNVWRVENYCEEIPHRKIKSSNSRYAYWKKKYLEFKKLYPGENPIYFKDRWTWQPGYLEMR
jgi:hypothetical protein